MLRILSAVLMSFFCSLHGEEKDCSISEDQKIYQGFLVNDGETRFYIIFWMIF